MFDLTHRRSYEHGWISHTLLLTVITAMETEGSIAVTRCGGRESVEAQCNRCRVSEQVVNFMKVFNAPELRLK